MPIKEIELPLDREKPEEDIFSVRYTNGILTQEEYAGITDLYCPYIFVGIGKNNQKILPFFADCRLHEYLEVIAEKELGREAKLFCFGQLYFRHGVFYCLKLHSSPASKNSYTLIDRNLRLLLENIDPDDLAEIITITWPRSKGSKEKDLHHWTYFPKTKSFKRVS